MNLTGHFNNLKQLPLYQWRGCAIYCWDNGYRCYLAHENDYRCYLAHENDIEWPNGHYVEVDPDFLKMCGIEVPFDPDTDEERLQFYYGKDRKGIHEPIMIELILPQAILQLMKLEGTELKRMHVPMYNWQITCGGEEITQVRARDALAAANKAVCLLKRGIDKKYQLEKIAPNTFQLKNDPSVAYQVNRIT